VDKFYVEEFIHFIKSNGTLNLKPIGKVIDQDNKMIKIG
jgi:hypothetical protein